MINKTLATYAILNYLSDRKQDIIDMYIPLVASLVVKDNLPTIERNNVCKMFREEYGISSLTYGAMESILNRMTKQGLLSKDNGLYIPSKEKLLPLSSTVPNIDLKNELNVISADIIGYAESTFKKRISQDDAEKGILDFLDQHDTEILIDIDYLNGKTVKAKKPKNTMRYIISKYILDTYTSAPQKIKTLAELSRGHLIAQTVSLDNLNSYKGNMKSVIVALDAPIIFNLLGLNGESALELNNELIQLLADQSVHFVIFNNNYNEVVSTLDDAEKRLRTGQYDLYRSSRVLRFAVREHKDSNFIKMKIAQLDDILKKWNISVEAPPESQEGFNEIDMNLLSEAIEKLYKENGNGKIKYYVEDLISTDVDSISYIYRLRGNTASTSLKNCKALLLTNNTAIAFASKDRKISSVTHIIPACLTDVFLSTVLWANFPRKNDNLNIKLLMNQCANNIALDDSLLKVYYDKVGEEAKNGNLTKEQVAQLTSTSLAIDLLEQKTLNDVEQFTDQTPEEILQEMELRKNKELNDLKLENGKRDANIKHKADIMAKRIFWVIWWAIIVILFISAFLGFVNGFCALGIISSIFSLVTVLFSFWTPFEFAGFIPNKEAIIDKISSKIYKRINTFIESE